MLKSSAGYFRKEPVENQATFDTALTVKDEHHLLDARVLKSFLDADVCFAYILSIVCEVALDL